MTLTRDGWIDGRPYARWPMRGEPQKYICLKCDGEMQPDVAVFEAHLCANYEDAPSLETVAATEGAIRLAREKGVPLMHLEGTGEDGRIVKSDVEE